MSPISHFNTDIDLTNVSKILDVKHDRNKTDNDIKLQLLPRGQSLQDVVWYNYEHFLDRVRSPQVP